MSKIKDDIENRTTYFGILRFSEQYLDAFQVLNKNNNKITNLFHVKFYLLAHSIELSLKAYLRYKKYNLIKLRNFGHDLNELYKELTLNSKYRLDDNSMAIIASINPYYKNKEFEYPKIGPKNVISLEDLDRVAEMILKSIERRINSENSPNK